MRRVALFTLAALSICSCKKKEAPPPPSDPNEVNHCTIEEAKVTGGELLLGHISLQKEDGVMGTTSLAPDGTLTIDVVHAKTLADSSPTRICGGKGTMNASSFNANKTGKTTMKLDGTCAPPPPGSIVRVDASFLQNGKTEKRSCDFIADIPRELGGTGLSPMQQAVRADWDKAAKDTPDLVNPILAYVATLAKVVAVVGDPTKERTSTSCASVVSGPASLFSYATLRAIADTQPGAPATPIPDEPTKAGDRLDEAFAASLRSAILASPTEYVVDINRVKRMSTTIAAEPSWVIVLSTRSYDMPTIEKYGDKNEKGIYRPGAFYGDVAIVDRKAARLLCGSSFSATGTGTTSDPEGAFMTAVRVMAWKTITRIAPGLKAEVVAAE